MVLAPSVGIDIGIGAGAELAAATPAAPQTGACAAAIAEPARGGRDAIRYSRWNQRAALRDDCASAGAKDSGGTPLLQIADRGMSQAVRMLLARAPAAR